MAGQGSNLGDRFEHLAYLLNAVNWPERMGVCFDTCHVFAAGLSRFGLKRINKQWHNLTKLLASINCTVSILTTLNMNLAHIKIATNTLAEVIWSRSVCPIYNDPRWENHVACLETAETEKGEDGEEINMDLVNLKHSVRCVG